MKEGEYMGVLKKYLHQHPIKFGILVLIFILIIIPITFTFSRFISEQFKDYYLSSKDFYFNSNRLGKDNPTYQINNWSGVDSMSLDISMNSNKNDLLYSDFDIGYDIEVVCPEDITCSLNKESGVIYEATHQDQFTLTIAPKRTFETDEKATVQVIATSTTPYKETISATFEFVVSTMEVSYTINDSKNQPYMILSITNSITYYKVYEAFGNYQVGDELDEETYLSLDPADRKKCASAIITLSFDPNDIVIDTTSSILNESTITTTNIDGVEYINSLTFPMDASSSKDVRFYKLDTSKDYTYPLENQTSIVQFSVR